MVEADGDKPLAYSLAVHGNDKCGHDPEVLHHMVLIVLKPIGSINLCDTRIST